MGNINHLQHTPEAERGKIIVTQALTELNQQRPVKFQMMQGIQLQRTAGIMQQTAEGLLQIDSTLPPMAAGAMAWGNLQMLPPELRTMAQTVQAAHEPEVAGVIQARDGLIAQQGADVANSSQVLPLGVLNEVPYHQQESERTCMAATFVSIFQGLTGIDIPEAEFVALTKKLGFEGGMETVSEEVLAVFGTRAFRQAFPNVDATMYYVGGFDFNEIQRVKDENKGAQIYFFPDLTSEVSENPNVHHVVTLLAADESRVIVHDPSNVVGSAYRAIPREDFMQRWAKGYFRGKLLIANVK